MVDCTCYGIRNSSQYLVALNVYLQEARKNELPSNPGQAWAWGQAEASQKKARAFIENMLNNARNTFRQFKNSLVFLLPTSEGVRVMEDTVVRLLALEAIDRQYGNGLNHLWSLQPKHANLACLWPLLIMTPHHLHENLVQAG